MILSKQNYIDCLQQDSLAMGKNILPSRMIIEKFFPDPVWKFIKLLRACEYYRNCKRDVFSKAYYILLKFRFKKLSLKLGFSIPENVFGPGLAIVHYGTIVVNSNVKVGANCRIHPSTCIGSSGGSDKAPVLGDNIYIAPGAKIYGDIHLANNISIAANAAVSSSFDEENIMIGGIPAKRLKSIDITKIIKHAANHYEVEKNQ